MMENTKMTLLLMSVAALILLVTAAWFFLCEYFFAPMEGIGAVVFFGVPLVVGPLAIAIYSDLKS